tara:strand:+ start:4250 stop:5059 length:810 start_codon:yes stop_codon:yes gene_type:complete
MTIYIYSDSYGQDCNTGWTWSEVLSEIRNEKFINQGLGGTGPNFSMRLLTDDLNNNRIKDNDSIVILLSDTKRLEFPWLTRIQHQDGLLLLGEEEETLGYNWVMGGSVQSLRKYLHKKEFIKEFMQTLGPMFLYENVKNISLLHILSSAYPKINFCVFTCFSLDHFTSQFTNFKITSTDLLSKIKFDCINGKNFHYEKTPVSFMVGRSFGVDHTRDKNPNHMTKEQNYNFANLCNDIIQKNEINTSWFAHQYNSEEPEEISKMKVFIYE